MPNKREFKKFVDALGASVVEEMMIAYYNAKGVDKQALSRAVGTVLDAIDDAKNKANVYFDRGAKSFDDAKEYSREKRKFFKALFHKIASEFNEEVQGAIKTFNAALPAEVKEAQKKSVEK